MMQRIFKCLIYFLILFVPVELMAQRPLEPDDLVMIEDAGSYPVELKYIDKQTGKEEVTVIYVTLYRQRTVENKEDKEAIDAHDLEINQGDLKTLSDADLIALTRARAWKTNSGEEVPITEVLRDDSDKDVGRFQVTFKTANGTATTIHIVEREEVIIKNQTEFFSFLGFTEIIYLEVSLLFLVLSPLIFLFLLYKKVYNQMNLSEDLLYKR